MAFFSKRPATEIILKALAIWGAIVFLFVLTVTLASVGSQTPETMQAYANGRAIILMASGLVLFWIVIGGLLMVHWREPIRAWVLAIPMNWRIKFVLFCTLMACLEEAVTTTMTNLAPVFGGQVGKSFITASTNYFQVICFNSVIVFIPMFVAWAIILSYYKLKPSTVMLLFGLTGTLAETGTFGTQNLLAVGMWVYVYGLMIYLPAYSLPERPKARELTFWKGLVVYVVSLVLPIICAIPLVPIIIWVKSTGFSFGPQFVP